MPASSSAIARAVLERVLREMYGGAPAEIEAAAGGFVVAVISAEHTDQQDPDALKKLLERVWQENRAIKKAEDRIVVFSFRFCRDERAIFSEEATLRTHQDRYENGILTRNTMLGDAFLLAHWVDSEALLIDRGSKTTCRVIQDPDFTYLGRLNLHKYVQFDLGGSSFGVRAVEPLEQDVWSVLID